MQGTYGFRHDAARHVVALMDTSAASQLLFDHSCLKTSCTFTSNRNLAPLSLSEPLLLEVFEPCACKGFSWDFHQHKLGV